MPTPYFACNEKMSPTQSFGLYLHRKASIQSKRMESSDLKPDPAVNKREQKQPWPMWPIGLSIAAFIVFYTWIQLTFRKPEKAFEPYQAMIDRSKEAVEKNLYGWYSIKPRQTDGDFSGPTASIATETSDTPLEKRLPEQLVYYLPRPPILLDQIKSLRVSSSASRNEPYQIAFEIPEAYGSHPSLVARSFYKNTALHVFLEWDVEKKSDSPKTSDSRFKTYRYEIATEPFEGESIAAFFHSERHVHSWEFKFDQPTLAK